MHTIIMINDIYFTLINVKGYRKKLLKLKFKIINFWVGRIHISLVTNSMTYIL